MVELSDEQKAFILRALNRQDTDDADDLYRYKLELKRGAAIDPQNHLEAIDGCETRLKLNKEIRRILLDG